MIKSRLPWVGIVVLVSLQAAVFAQGDERARELMAGIMPASTPDIHTMQQVMTMTTTSELVSQTHYIIDFDNRRAVIRGTVGEMQTLMRHVDGKSEMFIDGEEIDMSAIPGLTDPFTLIFEQGLLKFDYEDATYDGFVAYGDLVAGEQVTSSAGLGLLGMPSGTTMSYVFNDTGDMVASVSNSEDGTTMIIIFDGSIGGGTTWSSIDGATMLTYDFDGTSATLAMTITFEPAVINEPLDEALFD